MKIEELIEIEELHIIREPEEINLVEFSGACTISALIEKLKLIEEQNPFSVYYQEGCPIQLVREFWNIDELIVKLKNKIEYYKNQVKRWNLLLKQEGNIIVIDELSPRSVESLSCERAKVEQFRDKELNRLEKSEKTLEILYKTVREINISKGKRKELKPEKILQLVSNFLEYKQNVKYYITSLEIYKRIQKDIAESPLYTCPFYLKNYSVIAKYSYKDNCYYAGEYKSSFYRKHRPSLEVVLNVEKLIYSEYSNKSCHNLNSEEYEEVSTVMENITVEIPIDLVVNFTEEKYLAWRTEKNEQQLERNLSNSIEKIKESIKSVKKEDRQTLFEMLKKEIEQE